MFGRQVFWRESMKPARFLIFDGRVVLVLVPAFMHLRLWTLIVAMITMMVFWWFDRKGISADSILRFLRSKLVGPKRTARGVFEERTSVDFGFESKIYLARAEMEARQNSGQAPEGFLSRLNPFAAKKPAALPSGEGLNLKQEDDRD